MEQRGVVRRNIGSNLPNNMKALRQLIRVTEVGLRSEQCDQNVDGTSDQGDARRHEGIGKV